MIIVSKCPYRISLLGGSSDLDWFVKKNGRGISIGFAIKAYSTLVVKLCKGSEKGILNYSSREEYKDIEDISHPIIRHCLNKYFPNNFIEMSSFGDDLSGGGLGSSSSFTVALIKAIFMMNEVDIKNLEAANLASEIEINDLKSPIGRQDHYMCALGGINILNFGRNGKVELKDNIFFKKNIDEFSQSLFLIDTKMKRSAFEKLHRIKKESNSFTLIKDILNLADEFLEDLGKTSDNDFNYLLEDYLYKSWNIKKSLNGVVNNQLLDLEKTLNKLSFKVLKLLGAGGGGYYLVRYTGLNLNRDIKDILKKDLSINKVEIEFDGAKSWEI